MKQNQNPILSVEKIKTMNKSEILNFLKNLTDEQKKTLNTNISKLGMKEISGLKLSMGIFFLKLLKEERLKEIISYVVSQIDNKKSK